MLEISNSNNWKDEFQKCSEYIHYAIWSNRCCLLVFKNTENNIKHAGNFCFEAIIINIEIHMLYQYPRSILLCDNALRNYYNLMGFRNT